MNTLTTQLSDDVDLGFLDELAAEWPPERLRDFGLQHYRTLYRKAALRLKELEAENRDARAAGKSYKDRQAFTVKMQAGRDVLHKIHKRGAALPPFTVHNIVTPLDYAIIRTKGMEHFLKLCVYSPFV